MIDKNQFVHKLSEKEIKQIFNRWSKEKATIPINFAENIEIINVLNKDVFLVTLKIQYETRKVKEAFEPLESSKRVKTTGEKLDVWELDSTIESEILKNKSFVEKYEEIPIPNSERIDVCYKCKGDGEITCPYCLPTKAMWDYCKGTGWKLCIECVGKGVKKVGSLEMVCPKCSGAGEVYCPLCGGAGYRKCLFCLGTGMKQCDVCKGFGKLKYFDVGIIEFKKFERKQYYYDIPEDIFQKSIEYYSGVIPSHKFFSDLKADKPLEITIEDRLEEYRMIEQLAPILDKISSILKEEESIFKSLNINWKTIRLLYCLQIDYIPVTEINYNYKNKNYVAWIFGLEKIVFARDHPNVIMDKLSDFGKKLISIFKRKKF